MTTPTQAQIEAAANAIRIELFNIGLDPVEGLAEAALTAAAEVGGQQDKYDEAVKSLFRDEIKRLTKENRDMNATRRHGDESN